ncbi:O-methyltransferase [Staphylococcus durrellii]|uniref:O-methyltransferase n=1 Tax=Staphylococcus durrellii TaxID=2781773 RepID=UPI00189FCF9D|nr:O-methyltransferase [Staphylococcus durrellii]MBF7016955.1 O-methyltransferase [Staphylococcus durrellii]
MEKNQTYLLNLLNHNSINIENLRTFAEKNSVPIVDRMTLEMIKQIIRIHKPTKILEIGTAIGYSSMQFASIDPQIQVTTIERNERMQQQAIQNFEHYNFQKQIHLIKGDALEQFAAVENQSFDMIFIDAAKAQTQKFFELYTPLLKNHGVVITDNILYHDFVADIDVVRNRNVRQMVKKIQKYNEWLINNEAFTTNFLNIDDGLAISIKGE